MQMKASTDCPTRTQPGLRCHRCRRRSTPPPAAIELSHCQDRRKQERPVLRSAPMEAQRNPASSPCGFVSDVHGNLPALAAVLAEFEQQGVKRVYVAGDLLLGGDEPLECWRRLTEVDAQCIRGVSDTALCTLDPDSLRPTTDEEAIQAARFAATRAAIGDLVIAQLRRLPERLRIPMVDGREILMVHTSPANSGYEISHDLEDEEIVALIEDDPADIVVCGATHVPFQRRLPDLHVVNVGSVGAAPEGQVAHFTILTPRMEGALIAQDYVEY